MVVGVLGVGQALVLKSFRKQETMLYALYGVALLRPGIGHCLVHVLQVSCCLPGNGNCDEQFMCGHCKINVTLNTV